MYMRHIHPCGIDRDARTAETVFRFDLPSDLYGAVLGGTLVLFAGAGVSTESNIMPVNPLYEEVSSLLRIRRRRVLPFVDLMTEFSNKFDRGA
jgi:hypothetical protein